MNTEVYCISESKEVDVIQLGYLFLLENKKKHRLSSSGYPDEDNLLKRW